MHILACRHQARALIAYRIYSHNDPYPLGDAPRILLPATPTTTNSHHGCGYNEWQDSVCDVGVGGVSV